ncbi:protein CLT1, chloroplastic-like [Impatiens glandulifera]|uniref:protein CLT1, chloroplastic-like n=1 Tax=Impatiens glandulifera TaxID=253017 RepID=UPI001FB07E49|nr:protein CLT1, chloroplastic-like [Impatiens glandulifera]
MMQYSRRITTTYAGSVSPAASNQVPFRRLPRSSAIEIRMFPNQVVNRGLRLSLSLQSPDKQSVIVAENCCGVSGEERSGRIRITAAVGDCTTVMDLAEENRGGDTISEDEQEESSSSSAAAAKEVGRDRTVEVLIAAIATVVLGVGNRVLYKLALVPLKQYPFFLAQLATFGYVIVYFFILYIRYNAGIVTNEMLSLPKAPYVVIGLLEALAAASGMAAGAMLPGAAITILSQSFLVWQLLLSYLFLGRRYRFNQLLGCFLVAAGVIVTVASGGSSAGSLVQAGTFWSLLMIVSFLLQAADTVMKEVIFMNAAQQLKGGSVDLFVVNSYGSAFQALFICLLLPFLSNLWGIPFTQLPAYLKDGAGCFLNNGLVNGSLSSSSCNGAPLLPVLFVIVNMAFNISLLHLLMISSAVLSCLASTISVPLSVFLFTLPLPYLGVASTLPSGFLRGAIVLILGMLIYIWTPSSSINKSTSNTTAQKLSEPCCS